MKIAIITDVLGEENNGTTITTKRLIENMRKRNHQVLVVSPSKVKDDDYYQLKKRNFFCFNKYIEKNGVCLAIPDEKILREVISKADVVHIMLPFKTGRAAIKIANELNKPVTTAFHAPAEAITSHLGMKNFKLANEFIYKDFYKNFYKYTNFVHCPSAFIADLIRPRGYNMDLRIISNGVTEMFKKIDAKKPEELKEKFLVLFVGRLSKEKRHDLVIKAVANSKYKDNIQLIFAGDGPLKKSLEKMGSKLPNPPIMQFYKKDKLVEVINYSDLYVHASDIESEAIACLEAISCGKAPIISDSKRSATKSFALTEDNLFKAGDYKDLTKKIDYYYENPDKIKEMEKKYDSYTEQFKIEKSMDEMEKMFYDAINYKEKQLKGE